MADHPETPGQRPSGAAQQRPCRVLIEEKFAVPVQESDQRCFSAVGKEGPVAFREGADAAFAFDIPFPGQRLQHERDRAARHAEHPAQLNGTRQHDRFSGMRVNQVHHIVPDLQTFLYRSAAYVAHR